MKLSKSTQNKDSLLNKFKNQFPKLKRYAELIHEQNLVSNITGFKSIDEIFNQGIMASLLFFSKAQDNYFIDFSGKKILDIGSGAGFPTVPLLIALDNSFELVIIESITKRCQFLEKVKAELNLNITIINDRSENVLNYKDNFDIVTARALGSVVMIYLISNHHLKNGGIFLLPKGKNYKTEIDKFKEKFTLEKENLKSFEYFDDINNESSSIVIIHKNKPTPRGWPWKWSKIKNY
ncbi:16S rRNA (guanine(527)-N(7))-methyltransferase RsmG [Mycoplasma tauri]|nr:16S rRNA (guanine(527)-N(7))-methyltransferase RsmG [Mycoplasma tauri]MBZ4203438.1 16S rRNA (guanine(527)-N(7))-methyltransferase RsmG [Mycoplasma tauri]MBZ4204077.1 16S rRNA (guanine(527)-N(7))-methyltransferase RsmG [Mycoplasma tauri]MBZ4226897.1 16S rRNA (guanine(527)-N(7))-methyltransferase RsmG [Mycoplasma tauri]QSB07667.1 16S rRNA (guanine(527)-N(7))-methyltransferase RsmG [Mycoplasma tauri]